MRGVSPRWLGGALGAMVLHGVALAWLGTIELGQRKDSPLERPIMVELIAPRIVPASEPRIIQEAPARLERVPPHAALAMPESAPQAVLQDFSPPTAPPAAPEAVAASPAPRPARAAELAVAEPTYQAAYPAYLDNPAPGYPPLSRRLREQGRVVLRVRVSAAGAAEEVELRASSGHERLDEAARHAVRGWKFVPAKRGEEPVPAWVLIPISFRLES